MKNLKTKDWISIIKYLIPIIALVIANISKNGDPTEIENALGMLLTAILGLLGAIGVIKNHDKSEDR
ncbi:hypothetical protein PK21_gp29 [Geobacillus phage vB_GthS_PK2.1]|nr:hypothetical protein PK21_gp29 [Geobacillus phage vB_GthS_PK2.1]